MYLGKRHDEAILSLDAMPAPSNRGGTLDRVVLICSEFTSRCPVTGQPDFGRVNIDYRPKGFIVETKSLKLYLWGYRDALLFVEEVAARIASDFVSYVKPEHVAVKVEMQPRGGISLVAWAEGAGV